MIDIIIGCIIGSIIGFFAAKYKFNKVTKTKISNNTWIDSSRIKWINSVKKIDKKR